MEPRLEIRAPKKLVGMRATMSLAGDRTTELWRRFMPRRNEIEGRTDSSFISMQIYGDGPSPLVAPERPFEKWAAVQVANHDHVPEGMEPYTMRGGRYALFLHKGPASTFPETIKFIFVEWLPASGYALDDREHFEVLPADYSPIDPQAEEEVWIPIR
jgi:AraC family transcriptional regulator